MARTLIGNFKGPEGPRGERGPEGPQGPRGPQGVQGEGIENNMMGSENLFSMSREKWRYSGNVAEYDYKNGIIKFSNALYQFRYEIYLKKGDYTVSVDDVINPERTGYENTVTLSLYDSNESSMRTIGILGGIESEYSNTRSFDITETEEIENGGVFHIQISIASEGRHTGEINGLQIVRGELSPTWSLSTEDVVGNKGYVNVVADPFDIEGTSSVSPTVIESFTVDENTEQVSNGVFSLSPGFWIVDMSTRPTVHDINGGYALGLYYNGSLIKRETKDIKSGKTLPLSTILNVKQGDTFYFGFSTYSVSTTDRNELEFTLSQQAGNNRITMKKVGG